MLLLLRPCALIRCHQWKSHLSPNAFSIIVPVHPFSSLKLDWDVLLDKMLHYLYVLGISPLLPPSLSLIPDKLPGFFFPISSLYLLFFVSFSPWSFVGKSTCVQVSEMSEILKFPPPIFLIYKSIGKIQGREKKLPIFEILSGRKR